MFTSGKLSISNLESAVSRIAVEFLIYSLKHRTSMILNE